MASLTLVPGEKDPRKISDVVRQLVEGKSNAVGSFTLATGVTTTTVKAPTCSPSSIPLWSAQTVTAAAEPNMSYVASYGQFVLTHSSSAVATRSFGFFVVG